MEKRFEPFVSACERAFQFLVDEFRFQPPSAKQYGYECYVEFDRDLQTVSIGFGDGGLPILELAIPSSELDEPPESHLTKSGVLRSRRIPALKIEGEFDPENEEHISQYLNRTADEFRRVEEEFISNT